MKIMVIDAVTTREWLPRNRAYFERIADEGTEVEVVFLEKGPKTIETFHDVVYAGPEILRIITDRESEMDAFIINCCSDPALYAAREITDKVVLGPTETSMSVALHLGFKFSYISTLKKTAPRVRLQAIQLGLESRLASVVNVNITVSGLEEDPEKTVQAVVSAAEKAIERDGAEVIMLGCTGMADLAHMVRARLNVPLIEPALVTFKMAELFVKIGLRHNRALGKMYSPAEADKIVGYG